MVNRLAQRYGERWTRDELVLAFDLYCRIPFRQTTQRNLEVQTLASILGRTASSVARKLGNFGAFDPELRRRNIVGLSNTSRRDREIWDEFHSDWLRLVAESQQLRERFAVARQVTLPSEENGLTVPEGPSEQMTFQKQRMHQRFFRSAVLSSYGFRCCVTGLAVTECLIASHIVPWHQKTESRADPRNGLCMSATFDRLFDSGLMTLTDDLHICLASTMMMQPDFEGEVRILYYDGREICAPERFLPLPDYLRWHRERVFRG